MRVAWRAGGPGTPIPETLRFLGPLGSEKLSRGKWVRTGKVTWRSRRLRRAPSAAHERIRQLVDQNRQLMRRTGMPTSNPPAGAGTGRLLLRSRPGPPSEAIDVDDIYFVGGRRRRHAGPHTRGAGAPRRRADRRGRASPVEERLRCGTPAGREHALGMQRPLTLRQVRRRSQGEDWSLRARPAGEPRAAREPGRPRRPVGGVRRGVDGPLRHCRGMRSLLYPFQEGRAEPA